MLRKSVFAAAGAITVVIALSHVVSLVAAVDSAPASLTGLVSSQEEGPTAPPRAGAMGTPMEGVLVSAKRTGSTITVTVVSDAQGRYSFPGNRLEPGPYSVRIRAIGYELESPGTVSVTAQETARLDLRLRKTQDLAYQLSNGEWLMSMPGTDEQKHALLSCTRQF